MPSQRPIDYSHYVPWTRLFRTCRIATDPRKLLLAALAVTVLWCGDAGLSQLPFATATDRSKAAPWDAVAPARFVNWQQGRLATFEDFLSHSESLASRVLKPIQPLLAMGQVFFSSENTWSEIAFFWTRLIWALAVWSVFGGAIARLAALEFARDERGGLVESLSFSVRRFMSFFAAPLLPTTGILLLMGLCALGGLMGRIAYAGPWIVAIAWGVFVLLALLAVLIAVALAVSWPLMIAAVATENSDAFDGFSRAFSYFYSRPWQAIWYGIVAIVFGMLLVAAVDTLAGLVDAVASRSVATGLGTEATDRLLTSRPQYLASDSSPSGSGGAPANVVRIWLTVFAAIAIGFAVSYFWSAATVIYFLLRRADDGTDFDDVWLGEVEEDDLLPLAGIASGDQPVTERSHLPTVSSGNP